MFISNASKLCLIAAAGMLSVAAPALAQEAPTVSRMVQVNDLNLRTEAGAAILRHRVKVAARQVCGPAETMGSADYQSYQDCLTTAQAKASLESDAMIASARGTNLYASVVPAN